MPSFLDPRNGIRFGWSTGDDDYGPGVNNNFHRMSYVGTYLAIIDLLSAPPATTPPEHSIYLVGASPTGAWSSFAENDLAIYGRATGDPGSTLGWFKRTPKVGWLGYRVDEDALNYFDGSNWQSLGGLSAAEKAKLAGIEDNATIDQTPEEIRDALRGLTGTNRLSILDLKDFPQPDWNSTSGLSEILNKPTLSTVATTGAYSDLTGAPTVPDTEAIQDIVGGMFTGNTNANITSVYRDATGKIDLTVTGGGGSTGLTAVATDSTLTGDGTAGDTLKVAVPYSTAEKTKLAGIETSATADQTAGEIISLIEGETGADRLDASKLRNLPSRTQADFGETDPTSASFIRRKPAIPDITSLTSSVATNTANIAVNTANIASNLTKITALEAVGAEANVQSSWLVTDTSSDAYIIGKPTVPSAIGDLSDVPPRQTHPCLLYTSPSPRD